MSQNLFDQFSGTFLALSATKPVSLSDIEPFFGVSDPDPTTFDQLWNKELAIKSSIN